MFGIDPMTPRPRNPTGASRVVARVSGGRAAPGSAGFILLLSAVGVLAPLGIDTSLPALPLMARTLHASDGSIQATLGVFLLAYALGQLIVGPLSDRYGRRPLVIAGMSLFAAAGVCCAAARSIDVLIAARFVAGIGACAGSVVGRAMIRDVVTDRAGSAKLQSATATISGLVPMLAPLLGAAILPLGWRAIYVTLVIGGIALAAASARWLPETLVERAASAHIAHVLERSRAYLAAPRSLALCALTACSFAGLFAFISGSPFVLVRQLGLSHAAYGVAFAISAAAIIGGTALAGLLAHRVDTERMLGAASLAAAVAGCAAFARLAFAPQLLLPWEFVTLMAAYAFTFGLAVPNAFAAGMQHAGAMAGVAAGLLGATQTLGGALGSTVNGALPFQTSVDVGWSVGVAGLGVAGSYLWSLRGGDVIETIPSPRT